ncbi:pas pac domain protein [Stylonychia lemnae]|uniref:Pas pac domain protein n=1 Tax=Stylonychia lemnae TaxID=5949 RepID=A0A078B8V6_STYLE|nr:pas pac domain protein [Stylonychia lemnae]|eukprot:CDW90925.1 pas pac domain protein [Stylonychia lemnae]
MSTTTINNKQVLKDIKEQLEKEYSDIQQINQVIIKLAQKKNLSSNDIDTAREMMKINYKKNQITVLKPKRKDVSVEQSSINLDLNIKSNDYIAYDRRQLEPLKIKTNLQSKPSIRNQSKTNVLPSIVSPNNASNFLVHADDDKSMYRSSERNVEVLMNQRNKQLDPWKLMIDDDLNRYDKEKQLGVAQKRNSQSNYKDYLEKQMESIKAQKQFASQLNMQEAELLNENLRRVEQREREKAQNYRDKIKGIVEQNDQQKVNLLIQQQKMKLYQMEKDKREAIDADFRDKIKIQEEIQAIKEKQRKVSTDLDYLRQQNKTMSQTHHNSQFSSQRLSPRESLDHGTIANPFVDKADIVRHKNKINELDARNKFNMQNYEAYTVSPKERSLTRLEQDVNFQTILDERNKQKQQETSIFQKTLAVDNQNLSVLKSRKNVETIQQQIHLDRIINQEDLESSFKVKEQIIMEKKLKQRNYQIGLNEQIQKTRTHKAQHERDLSPAEIALNKGRLQHIDNWNQDAMSSYQHIVTSLRDNMENYNPMKKQSKESLYKKLVDAYFSIMLQLLKNKAIDQLWACVLIFIMFSQVFAGLFERGILNWQDEMLLEPFTIFCEYIRVVPAIDRSKSATYYWIVFYFVYLHYSLKNTYFYLESLVQLLRYLLVISNCVLFLPFYEIFISIFRCEDGHHYLIATLECYQTEHAIACLLSVLALMVYLSINAVIALLYNETQPVKGDALSRLDSNFEVIMLIYRVLIGTLSQFCLSGFCSWILIAFSFISSLYFQYQYFKFLPYYNNFVSIFFGSMVGIYTWITINGILTQFYDVQGHIVIIFIGIPIICALIKRIRETRIESLMMSTTEKMQSDIDSLNQICLIQTWLNDGGKHSDLDKEMKVKGLINLHIAECTIDDCVCKNLDELYDIQNDQYLNTMNSEDMHSNQVFVNHFNKQLYTEALNKFINSPSIHISFAFYHFSAMKNIHAALHELKIASKKRPTLQQQFTIFRYQNIIELFIKKESEKMKHIYEQLTNVKEFERLFQDMQKQIEKVCNYQVEFWTHLTTVVPDLNFLNDLNIKIFNAAHEADNLWYQLSEINSNYPNALNLYGEYLTFIRNNQQAGKEYFDKAHNVDFAQKSIQDHVKRSDILFTEDSTVFHISGNRESSGRVLKVSQGLFKCFGFSKQEVIGHNITIAMPSLFAGRHNEFLDCYYRTGRTNIFNRERQLFAQNRQGYCFTMKILIKQMPSLKEEVQYVGMVKPVTTDFEYILTDMQGNIDSFTNGIGSILSLNPQLFKDSMSVNIQMLAPELISIFEYRKPGFSKQGQNEDQNYKNYYRRPSFNSFQFGQSKFISNNKYSVPGGDQLQFIVPNNFGQLIKSEKPQKSNRTNGKKKNDDTSIQGGSVQQNNPNKFVKSAPFREFIKYLTKGRNYGKKPPDVKKLLNCKEYREFDVKKVMNIEIREWTISLGNNEEKGLKLLLFMIAKNQSDKRPDEQQNSVDGNQHDKQQPPNINQQFIEPNYDQQNDQQQYQFQQTQGGSMSHTPSKFKKNAIQNMPNQKMPNATQFANPMGLNLQSSGLTSKIQNQQILKNQGHLQQAISFLDMDQAQINNDGGGQNTLREERSNDMPSVPSLSKERSVNNQRSNNHDDLEFDPQSQKYMSHKKDLDKILQFERQETDEQEDDNEDQIDTDRIDVKKEIVLNDEIKQNTKSFEENFRTDSKQTIQKMESQNMVQVQQREAGNIIRNPYAVTTHTPPIGSNTQTAQNSSNLFKEDQKNQLKEKPFMEKISQSKDDDEGAEDDESLEDNEDNEADYDDDEGADDDAMASPLGSGGQSQEGSDEDLLENKRRIKRRSEGYASDARSGGSNRNSNVIAGQTEWNVSQQNSRQLQQQNLNPMLGGIPQPEKIPKIHDYARIVTNPRYQCFDNETCGSALFNDCNCSEKELDIREIIKKNQATKKRREKRRKLKKDEEDKKQDGPENQQMDKDKNGDPLKKQDTLDKENPDDKSKTKVKRMRGKRKESNSGSESKSKSRSRRSESRSKSRSSEDRNNKSQDDEDIEEDQDNRMPE